MAAPLPLTKGGGFVTRIRRQILNETFLSVAAVVATAAFFVIAVTSVSRAYSGARLVAAERDRIVEVRRLQRRLIVSTLEIESGRRAYLLSRSRRFLEQVSDAAASADTIARLLLDSVRGETVLEPLAVRGVDLFRRYSTEALRHVTSPVPGPPGAVMSPAFEAGPYYDSLRLVLAMLEQEADRRRHTAINRLLEADARSVRMVKVLGAAALLCIMVLFAGLVRVGRLRRAEIAARAERDQALEEARLHAAEARRLELESQLRQAQKMEALGQLTSGVAHDFNNILAVMLTSAELLSAHLPAEDDVARRDLEALVSAGRRGRDLIGRMMAFSRLQPLQLGPVAVAPLLADLRETLARLLPSNITVRAHCAENLPPVAADAGVLTQIILNLATNARDAMPGGGVLSLEAEALDVGAVTADRVPGKPGRYVRVCVTDTGVGMDRATLERAFEPFFTTKAAGRGTGLGLMMVADLVHELSGHVWLTSEIGKGTTVHLLLPVAAHQEAVGPEERAPTVRVARRSEQPATVLVVDDEPQLLSAMERVLERAGYRVLCAADGSEALDLARRERPDLVISDYMMPGLTGADLYTALKAASQTVCFILVTGSEVGQNDAAFGAEVGRLPKPWTVEELLRAVRDALAEAPSAYAASASSESGR